MAKFLKEVVKAGTYRTSDGQKFAINSDVLDTMLGNFQLMVERQVNVPVTLDHSTKADEAIGKVLSMSRKGDSLFAEIEIRDDAKSVLVTPGMDASIVASQSYVDGSGNKYDLAITAIGVTTTPVVAGQTPFVELSLDNKTFSLEGKNMDDKPDQYKALMGLLKTKLSLEIADDATPEAVAEAVAKAVEAKMAAEPKPEDKPKMMALDPDVQDTLVESTTERVDTLVSKGIIPPALKGDLVGLLCDGPYMLSRTANEGKPSSRSKQWLDVLAKLPPQIKLGRVEITSPNQEDDEVKSTIQKSIKRVNGQA